MSWQSHVGEGTPYHWTLWLWNAFVHATYWGTPDYKHLDKSERDEFTDMVKTGDLFTTVEELNRCVLASGVDLPDDVLSEPAISQIVLDKPLPESDRKRLEEIARKMRPLLAKLEVQEWQQTTATNGAQTAIVREPGNGERAPAGGTVLDLPEDKEHGPLSIAECDVLKAMFEMNATSETRRKKKDEIASKANRLKNGDDYKRSFLKLRERGFTSSCGGPNGGIWLTLAGKAEAERLFEEN